MAYSLFHIISTTLTESNSTLENIKDHLNGDFEFEKQELLDMIEQAKQHNKRLFEACKKVLPDISKEVF